jgi:hypothetical protein
MNRHTLRNDSQINAEKQTKILSLNEHETAIEKTSFEVEKKVVDLCKKCRIQFRNQIRKL